MTAHPIPRVLATALLLAAIGKAEFPAAQSRQKVHSNEQITASGDCGGRSRLQHSQFGRSWSMCAFLLE